MSLNANGDLVLRVAGGVLIQGRPAAYQTIDGKRHAVRASYRFIDGHSIVFDLGSYDARLPLIIDPSFEYATSVGGSYSESPTSIAVDSSGAAYVTGGTLSLDFPTLGAIQ